MGYLRVEGLPQAVKVWGLKNLNRSFSLDEVVVRFVQWCDWGRANDRKLLGIDFDAHKQYTTDGK